MLETMLDIKRRVSPQGFIDELEKYQEDGYLFRGHMLAEWLLQPQAFRTKDRLEIASHYPVPQKELNKWKTGKVLGIMWDINKGLPPRYWVNRVIDYTIYLLQYNHYLLQYYLKLPLDLRSPNEEKLILRLTERDLACEQTFIDFIYSIYPFLFYRISPEGRILMQPAPIKEITGFEETFAQHYSFPTAALDWTSSFPIALHFAVRDIKTPWSIKLEPIFRSNFYD